MKTTATPTPTPRPNHHTAKLRDLAALHLDMARRLDTYLRHFELPLDPSRNSEPEFNDETAAHMLDSIASAKQTADMVWAACMRIAGIRLDEPDPHR